MARIKAKSFFADVKGVTAVEFAFVFPMFLMFTFGVLEFGQGLKVHNELSSAASRAARLVMLDDEVSNSVLETQIRTVLDDFVAADLEIDVSTDSVSGKTYRVVNISYPHQFTTPFLAPIDITLSATSRTAQRS